MCSPPGDKGPEVFYEVQKQVVRTIEDKYYQPFVISDYYKEMLIAIESENNMLDTETVSSGEDKQSSVDSISSVESGLNVGDHSNYARRKLDQLEEKLSNKMQVGRPVHLVSLFVKSCSGFGGFEILNATGIQSAQQAGEGGGVVAGGEKTAGGSFN